MERATRVADGRLVRDDAQPGLARLERGDYAGARASLERALEGLGAARERNVSMIYELQLARAYVAYAQAQLEELGTPIKARELEALLQRAEGIYDGRFNPGFTRGLTLVNELRDQLALRR